MRLLVDLFPCQTDSRYRGIGRYTLSLVKEMARLKGNHDFYALADAQFSEGFEYLRQEFTRILPTGKFLPYFHNIFNPQLPLDIQSQRQVAEVTIRHAYQCISPDIVLSPSPFELDKQGVVPSPISGGNTYKQVAILYDIIPLLFHEQYLDNYPETKAWYNNVITNLPNYDLLLSISEATRQDAIRELRIPPEQIVNISGSANNHFRKIDLSPDEKASILSRFGIERPFVLYIGGDNFRKNMEGALRAYARLPRDLIDTHQFVINDAGDKIAFHNKVRSLGLKENDVVITGFISDEDLISLYNLCKVFVFPSFYEGFGLPVLEAMACGAPVLAANNSSLPEIVGRSDALFDVNSEKEIVTAICKVLSDDSFRMDLAEYGLIKSREFSWEKSAQRAWDAIESLQQEKKTSYITTTQSKKSKPRIAYVSPLPPQKTGIANYSAELLPYLAKHFNIDLFIDPEIKKSNIDLHENFSILSWNSLIKLRDQYETVVYHFGNSPFHEGMVGLERQLPGVVVLHDFYLCDLMAYAYQKSVLFEKEIDYCHGIKGLIDFQLKKSSMFRDWPINWKIIRYAHEIIVHSHFQTKLFNTYYGKGWTPKINFIPHLRVSIPEVIQKQRLIARNELGMKPDDFIICSFGLLTDYKLTETIIRAYAQKKRELGLDTKLMFVGDFSTKEYSQQISRLIKELDVESSVSITGYVNNEVYRKHLLSANMAVQLRKDSRGETSGAVLDCMNYALPIIVNAHGSQADIHEDDVIKISEFVTQEELALAMIRLRNDENLRNVKGKNAKNTILAQHNPEKVADLYADVIHRAILSDDRTIFKPIFESAQCLNDPEEIINSSAELAARNFSLRNQPRLLVDVSTIAFFDAETGIQRVVKSIMREFFNINDPSMRVEPIWWNDDEFLRAFRFTEKLLNLPDHSLGPETQVLVQPGDTIFMLDSSWHLFYRFSPLFQKIRENGGRIITMVYDLIPIRFPGFVEETMKSIFKQWIDLAIQHSDMMVCISHSTANDVRNYISESGTLLEKQPDITSFHLGADIPIIDVESKIRPEISNLNTDLIDPMFLMVGTLEPRKGHEFILSTFESLWQQGYRFKLCFAGKVGWHVEKLERRIREHIELGKRLLFFENPTDTEINLCYQSATALIAASQIEGFGLPIIEAAQYKVPVLASDIPVFREVGGEGAEYFSIDSQTELAESVIKVSKMSPAERKTMAEKVEILTWEQSAAWLQRILFERPLR